MKYAALAFFVTSCAALGLGQEPQAPKCEAPPQEYLGGKLIECRKNEYFFACALAFQTTDGKLCAYIVVQPADNCLEPFQYAATECAEPTKPEDQKTSRRSNYDSSWDEGEEETI